MRLTIFLSFLLLGISSCFHKPSPPESIFLEDEWSLEGSEDYSPVKIQFPSGIHSELLRSGQIGDPYRDKIIDSLEWIWKEDWTYKVEFDFPSSWAKYENVDLELEEVDTYAEVYVNDSLVSKCSNYFVKKTIPIKAFCKTGNNELKIVIQDPERVANDQYSDWPIGFPGEQKGKFGKPLRPFIRKPAYQFGWDFSPRLITGGIYSAPVIRAWSNARISAINLLKNENALSIQIRTEASNSGDYSIQVNSDQFEGVSAQVELEEGSNIHEIKLPENSIPSWEPIGVGNQNTVEIRVQLFRDLRRIDEVEKTVGHNNAKLIRRRDSIGESFFFEINGNPVFARGGNLVPLDIQIDKVKPEHYHSLIKKLVEANFNMVRVWGGGRYQDELFYDLCDQSGIMIWQDFMFANTYYPWDSSFLIEVEQEVRQQILRLKDHPSIVLWCGNNEVDLAWKNWGWQKQLNLSPSDSTLIWEKYRHQFDSLIGGLVKELDPGRSYLASSPLSNFSGPEDYRNGNVHDWSVWHGEEPIEVWTERSPRFNSEYGMQNIPSLSLLQSYSSDTLTMNGDFFEARQRASKGKERMKSYIESQYRRPRNLEHQIFVSQSHQALAIGEAAEFMRISQPRTMGSLVWQINDTWPGISWSIIDYEQNEKPAYHRLKKAFEPIMVYSDQKNRRMKITAVNGSTTTFRGLALVSRKNFFGTTLSVDSVRLNLEPGKTFELAERYIGTYLDTGLGRWTFFHTEILADSGLIHEDLHFMEKPRALWLRRVAIDRKITKSDDGFLIELSSDFLAKDVWLESMNVKGKFSRNHFDLIPGSPRTIVFKPSEGESSPELNLKVQCLNDFR